MKQVEFFIKKSKHKVVPPFFTHMLDGESAFMYRPVTEELERQVKEIGLSAAINIVDIQNIPTKVESYLVAILDENSLITDDYVSKILSINNLYRDASMFCGPVLPIAQTIPTDWFIGRISKTFKLYEINGFSSFSACYLNQDIQNYPHIDGCIFSGRHYNQVGGYRALFSPRTLVEKNDAFFAALDKIGPIVYSDRLKTLYYITSDEYDLTYIGKYYYSLGYSDGLSNQPLSQIVLEATDVPVEHRDEYESHIAALRGMYELGRIEAKSRNKIV